MMKTLLKNERHILLNTIRTMPIRNIIGFGLVIMILSVFLYFVSRAILSVGSTLTPNIFMSLFSYTFLFVLGFVILLGTAQVFKDLYTADDLQILFTMPIQTRHIYWLKYIKSFVNVPLFIVILFIIPLWIFGLSTKASIFFYPVSLIVLIMISLIGLSISFLLNLILAQIIPANRANEFVTIMSFFSGIFAYFLFMYPSMREGGELLETIGEGLPILPKWIPITWGAVAVVETISGSWRFVLPFILLIVLTIVLIILSTLLTERGFRHGWIRLNEGGRTKKRKRTKKLTTYKVRHPIIALGKKEWYTIKRDMREWIALMPIVVFFIFGLFGFFTSGGIKLVTLREYSHISWPIGQVIFLFLLTLTNGAVAANSIGREGPNAWIFQVLPVRGIHIAYGKLWISWLIPFVVISILEIGFSLLLAWPFNVLIIGIVMKAVITLGSSSLGLWLGTIGAKYHPTNPQSRLTFSAGALLFILSYVYLILVLIPFSIIVVPPDIAVLGVDDMEGSGAFSRIMLTITKLIVLKGESPALVISLCILTMLVISLGTMFIFTKLSARRIDRGITIKILSESRSNSLFSSKRTGINSRF